MHITVLARENAMHASADAIYLTEITTLQFSVALKSCNINTLNILN